MGDDYYIEDIIYIFAPKIIQKLEVLRVVLNLKKKPLNFNNLRKSSGDLFTLVTGVIPPSLRYEIRILESSKKWATHWTLLVSREGTG